MFNRSIAYRLKIYVSTAVIIVFIIFILLLFFYSLRLLRENIENRAINLSSRVNIEVSKDIYTTQEVSLNIASQIYYYNQHNDAERLLNMVMSQYPFLNAVYVRIDSVQNEQNFFFIRREDNSFIYHENEEDNFGCHIDKEVVKLIYNRRDQGWTNPYRCERSGKLLVSFYCPVKLPSQNGKDIYCGQIVSELSLLELNNRINNITIKKRGYVFITNRNGDFISHPKKEWILKRNMYKLPEGLVDTTKVDLHNILTHEASGSFIAHPEMFNFKKCQVYYTPINQDYWMLFFVMPYKDLFSELYFRTFVMILFALLGIIVIYRIITFISTKLIEPLSLVTTQLNKFSRPDNYRYPETKNEIKQVSESLSFLKSWFNKYKAEQELEMQKSYRHQQDMAQASEIQQSFIKNNFSDINKHKNINLYAIYKPAGSVGGDFFDYFFIENNTLVFTIGDVSGTGVPAALFMSIAQASLKQNASYRRAKTIVKKANKDLCTSSQHQFFLTLFIGVLNIKTGMLNYCNAAHTTTFILKANGTVEELNSTHGLPLGLYYDKGYEDTTFQLEKNDIIVMYTDGVTNLENREKKQFGINRLKEYLHKLSPDSLSSPQNLVMDIEKKLEEFRGEIPQADDICIFILKYQN